jgi:hypothetical protein
MAMRNTRSKQRRTDLGTILLHAGFIATAVVALLSGLRIADIAGHVGVARWFESVMPADRPWLLHLSAGYGLLACLCAYAVYVVAAGLRTRIALDAARLAGLLAGGERRWQAVNALLAWTMLATLLALAATGIAFHLGAAPFLVSVHRWLSWIVCALVPAHLASQFAAGGTAQVLRILRPAPEPLPQGQQARGLGSLVVRGVVPSIRILMLLAGLVAGTGAALAYFGVQRIARQDIRVVRAKVATDALLDPDLRASPWASAPMTTVATAMGTNLGGPGTSTVSIRALHDGRTIWMAFTWDDPTRSVEQGALVKTATGWARLTRGQAPVLEDQFAVMFAGTPGDFGPGAFHPGERPLPDRPPSSTGKGLHFTRDGSTVDLWHWHASTGEAMGACGHDRFGPAGQPTTAQASGERPYRGGMQPDRIEGLAVANIAPEASFAGAVRPLRLPRSGIAAEGILTPSSSVPFGEKEDAMFPEGAVIPGLVALAEPTEAKVRCRARWSAGRWTLVAKRNLETGDARDIPLVTGTSVWVAVFDQTVAGHTRHLRPLTLEIEP